MQTRSYTAIADSFKDTIDWLKSLGIRVEGTRTAEYLKTIEYWRDNYLLADEKEAIEGLPKVANAILEITDFVEIHNAFRNLEINDIKPLINKLSIAVSGPESDTNETSKNNKARNYLFELLVTARMHRPNGLLRATLKTAADTQIEFDGRTLFLESKRLTSQNKVEANASDASKQLRNHIIRASKAARGFIALDITKLQNTSGKIIPYDEHLAIVGARSDSITSFIARYENKLKRIYKKKDSRMIGSVIRHSYLAAQKDTDMLITVNNWGIFPRPKINNQDTKLLERINKSLNI